MTYPLCCFAVLYVKMDMEMHHVFEPLCHLVFSYATVSVPLDLLSWHGSNVMVFSRALSHNNEHMGRRYIEVFESKYSEMEWVVTRMQGGQSDSEGVVRLRGLPYGAQKQDIAEFFAGM